MKRTQILFALAAVALLLTPHGQALAQAMGALDYGLLQPEAQGKP